MILKILAIWTLGSIALGLILAWIMNWTLHYEPPELPPLPSGSLRDDASNSILHNRRERVSQ